MERTGRMLMDRTEKMVLYVIDWLPDPEDATIFADDRGGEFGGGAAGEFGGGAAREGGDGAAGEFGGGAVREGGGCAAGEGGGGAAREGGGGAAREDGGGAAGEDDGEGGLAVGTSSVRVRDGQEAVPSAVGWYGRDRYDQCMDLYLRGRPTSSYWEPIWASLPLKLHDRGLVLAHNYLQARNPEAQQMQLSSSIKYAGEGKIVDLTLEITNVLNSHPGPIDYFRIDSSCWHDAKALFNWIKILSDKRIQRLILLNLAHAPDIVFPIEMLQSPVLSHLSLGFMKIPDLDMNSFDYSCLDTLKLFGCSFDGRRLSWVITHCPCLKDLTVGMCTENLRVISDSLVRLQIWQCEASWLSVSSSPKLELLTIGVSPAKGCSIVSVAVDGTPQLQNLNGLQLPLHEITINHTYITKDFISLNSIVKLSLGLNMANADQRYCLLKILHCMPMLWHLTLRRMDDIALGEGTDMCIDSTFDGLHDIPCIKSELTYFKIQAFKGGPAEFQFLRCIMRHACQLMQVRVVCCEAFSQQAIVYAGQELRDFPRASEACLVTISKHQSE